MQEIPQENFPLATIYVDASDLQLKLKIRHIRHIRHICHICNIFNLYSLYTLTHMIKTSSNAKISFPVQICYPYAVSFN